MSTVHSPQEASLQESMIRLEAAFLAPVVSGELQTWVETVNEVLADFGPVYVAYVKDVLHPQYKEIGDTDSDLLPRVEQMIEEDRKLLGEFAEFQTNIRDLATRAEQVGKNEGKAEEERERVEKSGVALTVRIKKQQSAAAVWLQEATFRDRGVGD